MRYLGMSLGYALSLGITASIGTLIPPIFHGDLGMLFSTNYGIATLTGIVVCLFGIGIVGKAGKMKDDNLPKEKKQSAIEEFNFKKGVIVAIIAGIMSACFAFGLDAGKPIADLAIKNGTHSLFQSSAVYLLVLAGGFTTNFIWCLSIMLRKRSYKQLFQFNALWIPNLSFSALAGIIWYFQFLFYGMGSSKLGRTMDFASWTIHMAFIIIFSNIWALVLKEWIGVKSGIIRILFIGLGILVFSTVIIGFGSYLKGLD